MRRVVITGIGAVTPLSNNFHNSWSCIKNGISGIDRITRFDVSAIPWKMAGELKNTDFTSFLSKKEVLRLDPFVHYAVAAAIMAAEDAGLQGQESEVRSQKSAPPHPLLTKGGIRRGVIIGSSRGGITTIEKELQKLYSSRFALHGSRLSPYLMPSTTISAAASYAAKRLGIKGYCLGISNACASGTNAIGEAFRLIRHGYADLMFAGGTEAPLCRLGVEGYGISGALSKRSEPTASRPFDRTRDGFVLAEGSCVLALEEHESALKRNAKIYGEIIGYSNTTDAFHMTKPDTAGETFAMLAALRDGGITPEEVDYINAHATSTILGDRAEAEAIRRAFGSRSSTFPVSSIKSMTGHMLAASGAFETACTVMSIKEGIIPPTINLTEKDPCCDLNIITGKTESALNYAITNSFGFGGVNAVLALKRQLSK